MIQSHRKLLFTAFLAALSMQAQAYNPQIPADVPQYKAVDPDFEALTPEEIAPGVFVMASDNRHGNYNSAWVVDGDSVTLIGTSSVDAGPDFPENMSRALSKIEASGKKVSRAIMTQSREGDLRGAAVLVAKGIELVANPAAVEALRAAPGVGAEAKITAVTEKTTHKGLQIIPMADNAGSPELIVLRPGKPSILFAGEIVVNGPHAPLAGTKTDRWLKDLETLSALDADIVVPGRGYVSDGTAITRLNGFLTFLRARVSHKVARGESLERIQKEVKLPTEFSATMPYDYPTADDFKHIHEEVTVPNAPFYGVPFDKADKRPKAIVITGDQVHDPLHLVPGLQKAMEAAGIDARFSVDPMALSAENLAQVDLFVILRDGTWFDLDNPPADKPFNMWMKPEQQAALKAFIDNGGGFLALHNCHGLYPEGPYIDAIGGLYNGHGPMEHFNVHVVDKESPITKGIESYQIWDEQHTPILLNKDLHHILESTSQDGVISSAGWTRTQGNGRIVYLANGHSRQAINHPMFQKLMVQAAHWCLNEKAPK